MSDGHVRIPRGLRVVAGSAPRALDGTSLNSDRPLGLSRRSLLLSSSGALVLVACGKHQVLTSAASSPAVSSPVITEESASFLRLSKALTGHGDLDATTAARLVTAFAVVAPDMRGHFASMGALVRDGISAPDVLSAATTVGLRPVALAIVAAWYTGTVGQGVHARTVSYRDALMQRPVADALSPPTYALGGPAWWSAEPPDVGVPARTKQVAQSAVAASAASSAGAR